MLVMKRLTESFALLLLVVTLSGCESLHFYQQAIRGQTNLLWERQSMTELLASEVDPVLRQQLELAGAILEYAEDVGLDSGGAYTSYVETGRPYVLWNVFAADPLEMSLRTSCFPVAGCVSYRGYFREQDAQNYADKLRAQGYDVYIGGVGAYSTLGWFKDPLLDTFLFRPEEQLAAMLFHELAHHLVYVQGDTRFNESLATAVEQFVLEQYLQDQGRSVDFQRYLASRDRQAEVVELINNTRETLRAVYDSQLTREEKLEQKRFVLERMVERYDHLAASWSQGSEYRNWMLGPMNNAKLETVADYHEWVPVMLAQLNTLGFDGFVAWLQQLAKLPESDRQARLRDASDALQ